MPICWKCHGEVSSHGALCAECNWPDAPDSFVAMKRDQRILDDRYELLEFLGEGGMGQVWRARDQWLDMEVEA